MTKKRKIAVNTRFLLPNKLEGIGTYTHQVLQRVVKLLPEVEFHFLFDRQWDKQFIYAKNVIPHKLWPPARHPFLWYWWFELSVNDWLKRNKMDLFFSPDSFSSLKTKTPTLLIMHDIAFEHFPQHLGGLVRSYYQTFFPLYAKKAHQILAVSNFTKQDIVEKYKIDERKIGIAPCAAADIYQPVVETVKIATRKKYSEDKPYFVCVGSINPRKNLDNIIKAFDQYKSQNTTNQKLVIVGAKGWETGSFYEALNQATHKKDIILTGHLSPEDLHLVLASSIGLFFPSLYEGFGIPILEAMQSGVPVVTSNVSSMPEVAGDAAIFVNPSEVEDIAKAFVEIKNTDQQLIKKGFLQAQQYSWDKTAEIVAQNIVSL